MHEVDFSKKHLTEVVNFAQPSSISSFFFPLLSTVLLKDVKKSRSFK